MSAYAMWMGLRGDWTIDLHRLSIAGHMADEGELALVAKGYKESWWEPPMSHDTLVFRGGSRGVLLAAG